MSEARNKTRKPRAIARKVPIGFINGDFMYISNPVRLKMRIKIQYFDRSNAFRNLRPDSIGQWNLVAHNRQLNDLTALGHELRSPGMENDRRQEKNRPIVEPNVDECFTIDFISVSVGSAVYPRVRSISKRRMGQSQEQTKWKHK